MTVAELIERLQELPQHLEVVIPDPDPHFGTGDASAVRRGVGPGGPGSRRRGRLGSRRGTRRPDARLEAGRRAGHRRRTR